MENKDSSILQLFKKYRASILFLVRFLGVYILGNIVYGFWVVSYGTIADPITRIVAKHSSYLLHLVGIGASILPSLVEPNVAITLDGNIIVNVYEGCNAINVSILFLAFIIAYKGSWSRSFVFIFLGLISIYVFNLLRVSGLFLVARYFPNQLYLMHKFVFTGIIYAFVFLLWFIWVRWVSQKNKS
ncbi:MAG: exosortase family protein XrtF [Cyclobacteriaceae bacterium]|nr:exosortase family protein XrtF [Cyclobacteriaceae bacterium]